MLPTVYKGMHPFVYCGSYAIIKPGGKARRVDVMMHLDKDSMSLFLSNEILVQ